MFATKHLELYDIVPYDDTEMDDIKYELLDGIAAHGSKEISVRDVYDTVDKLKYNKNDGVNDLSTNHLKFAGSDLFWHLTQLLHCIIVYTAL
jgi:hypothetical protein